jgi:3-isopropylmalate/(R)-2-methylmalate dehydratase large subunit
MGQTITEKILARHCGRERVIPGETIEAKVDVLMMHDITSSDAIKLLRNEFKNRVHPELSVVVTPDHYVPGKDISSAILYKELKGFVNEQQGLGANVVGYMIEGGDYGVCHVMLPSRGHIIPGDLIVGGDSHTCTYGALGAFSTGIGTTEAGNVLATGSLWFRIPESFRIEVNGKMPKNVMAKDLFLQVVGDVGVDGCLYQAMEWKGDTIRNMSMDERMTLTNMAIEAGAKSGIIEPDDITYQYLDKIGVIKQGEYIDYGFLFEELKSDTHAQYNGVKKINADALQPLVAMPHLPSNIAFASELRDIKINQAYIGSCTGGKWEDFAAAAEILKGNKIAKGVRLLIVPSTSDIQDRIVESGLYKVFKNAGAVFSAPTCGACLGGYMGVLAPGEVCISSTNRNFRGRMGHLDSEVYLASPKTVAASAIAGYITGAKNE